MDQLPHDLVDYLVHLLPPSDLQILAKAVEEKPELENWKLVTEAHLKKRCIIDLDIVVRQRWKMWDSGYLTLTAEGEPSRKRRKKGAKQNQEDKEVEVHLGAVKRLCNGETAGEWDFKNLPYVWIRSVNIHSHKRRDTTSCCRLLRPRMPIKRYTKKTPSIYHRADLQEVRRNLSLPVEPSEDGFHRCLNLGDVDSPEMDIALQMLPAAQKTFSRLILNTYLPDKELRIEDFIDDYAGQEGSLLEYLSIRYVDGKRMLDIAGSLLFEKKRIAPFQISFSYYGVRQDEMDTFVKRWQNSDGSFDAKKQLQLTSIVNLASIKKKYCNPDGYAVHPSRGSSLYISSSGTSIFENCIQFMKFQPWHLPVTAAWIDAEISKWKAGDGFRLHDERELRLFLESGEEWSKHAEKYGPLKLEGVRFIAHRSGWTSLKVKRLPNRLVTIEMKYKQMTHSELMEMIKKWEDGDGSTVVDQLKRVEFRMLKTAWNELCDNMDSDKVCFMHPNKKTRLIVQRIDTPLTQMSVEELDE
ncbi:hypothetical protein QR680_003825 [Steinernema hermaphroditum]|uniref:F-box domain-containing protein n=1 Tax=Steinernema hermaphroditum TaxID=289476 RepID=A0AA39LSR1_9BILA|nr:hypothetical protein QR680_003825 [Steinernema hermaphroditum]